MKKYIVTIEETVVQDFEIEAERAEEAFALAEEQYDAGELVLEPGEVQMVEIAVNGVVDKEINGAV